MGRRVLIVGLACAAVLFGQRKFSWQNYCFEHPGSIVCSGNDYAVKQPKQPKDNPRSVITNPFPPPTPTLRPLVDEVGQIDWRFADPSPDAVGGVNLSKLAVSPLAFNLIVQLAARQNLKEEDVRKLLEGLSAVDQIGISIRDNRIVVMLTGGVTDATLPASATGLKAVPLSGGSMLVGHADAVDQAALRIGMKGPATDLTEQAQERQASSEFWMIGAARLIGPEAVSAGVKRFSLMASAQNQLTSELAFEVDSPPNESALKTWEARLGDATVEGNIVRFKRSVEADEAKKQFGEIAAGPLGGQLAALVDAARYLPTRSAAPAKRDRPMIYGLDGGPREVNQLPRR